MRWIKKGKIFSVSGDFGWMNTHAQVPTVLDMGEKLRVYFSTRHTNEESKIAFLDVSADDPSKVLYIHSRPLLNNGSAGTFDEHGLMPSSVMKLSTGETCLFYSGWSRRHVVPYSNLTGLATAQDSENFKRVGAGPVLSTNINEPFSATSPCVIQEKGTYYMFYCSGTAWHQVGGKYEHTYDIKLATSYDGISWQQTGRVCVEQADEYEAITRPTVLNYDGRYHMWFCFRGSRDFRDGEGAYRIGYATSDDLLNWTRNDNSAGINPSEAGWDSKMLAYPHVIATKYGVYLFYNGNGFGRSGFGYALLVDL